LYLKREGRCSNSCRISDDFDDPLPADIARAFCIEE
jgi:hypothetical protein